MELAAFVDVSGVLIKICFVRGESMVSEAFHHLNSLIIGAGGIVGEVMSCAMCAGSVD